MQQNQSPVWITPSNLKPSKELEKTLSVVAVTVCKLAVSSGYFFIDAL